MRERMRPARDGRRPWLAAVPTSLVVLSIFACACSSAPRRAAEPALRPTPPSLSERIEAAIRTSNALPAFRVEYLLTDKAGERATLRILYQAPDRMRIDGGDRMQLGLLDGAMDVRIRPPRQAEQTMRFDVLGVLRTGRAQLDAAFVSGPLGRNGPLFGDDSVRPTLNVTANSSPGEHGSLSLAAAIASMDVPLLGWLSKLGRSDDVVEVDEERVQFTPAKGIRFTVSLRTGFIERAEHEPSTGVAGLELQKLELTPRFAASDFVLPDPQSGSVDTTEMAVAALHASQADEFRSRLLQRVVRDVEHGDVTWSDPAKAHLQRVLGVLHEDAIRSSFASWIGTTNAWIASLRTRIESVRSSNLAGDSASIDVRIDEARSKFEQTVTQTCEEYRKTFSGRWSTPPGAARLDGLDELETAAREEALDRVLRLPLRRAFAEAIGPSAR